MSIPSKIGAGCNGPDQCGKFDRPFRSVIAVPKAVKQEAKCKRTRVQEEALAVLRPCMKPFLIGIAVALFCYSLSFLSANVTVSLFPFILMVWPSALLFVRDMPVPSVASFLGIAVVINGLLYATVAAVLHGVYARIDRPASGATRPPTYAD
jgi:hypothetical protein